MKNTLKSMFWNYSTLEDLGIFYNALDDGALEGGRGFPSYSGPSYIPWANRLDQNLNNFGESNNSQDNIVGEVTDGSQAVKNFANVLFNKIIYSNGYLSLMVHWHYTLAQGNNSISDYHLW